jgi:phosphoribosyl-AMP cyclohydrolase
MTQEGAGMTIGAAEQRFQILDPPRSLPFMPPIDATAALALLKFDDNGLVPAIAQQHDSGEVLMMAWMNRDAVTETLATGRVCYWSRSRQGLWRKGETSGQQQRLVDLLFDCDGDTILLKVDQDGVACHTGRRTCFYTAARSEGLTEVETVMVRPEDLYGK